MLPDTAPVAGIVLAAGASTRMGRNKLLLELDGRSILRRVVGRATTAGLEPLIVVLGYEADRARQELSDLPCRLVVNPEYERGAGRSLGAGIEALPVTASAAVVMLADMPFVTSDMMATLVGTFRSSSARLVISDYGGVSAPPVLYDRSLFAELAGARGDGPGREVVRRHRGEAAVVSWPPDALADLDLPEDYERAWTRIATEAGCSSRPSA